MSDNKFYEEYNALREEILHYGTPRHSGRYPWGSGKKYQRSKTWYMNYKELKGMGLSEQEICAQYGLNSSQLRAKVSLEKERFTQQNIAMAVRLREKGVSITEIARRLQCPYSTVQGYLKPSESKTKVVNSKVADTLKEQLKNNPYIDVSTGSNLYLGVSEQRLKNVLNQLKEEGYGVHNVSIEQLGTGKMTTYNVLTPPGVSKKEAWEHRYEIKPVDGVYFEDNGYDGPKALQPPRNIDSDRVYIRYAEDGGVDRDGLIELRRGVDELSLGKNNYAQVRIAVDGDKYMKGMAVYSDDIPEGYDVIYNTNKTKDQTGKVFKKQDLEKPTNPFGAAIKQKEYEDADGNMQLSAINYVNEEGDWANWSRTLASQELSKQPWPLAKKQLGITKDLKYDQYEDILSITNPTIKKEKLLEFADECDGAAEHLKAAAMPRQATAAIIPLPNLKEDEIYAPLLKNGESVILIRHPHEGTFQIPRLTVNNSDEYARKTIGIAAIDAVGIHPKAAEKLSGADFDGDTVLVIPDNNRKFVDSPALKGLEGFDAKTQYARPDGTTPAWKKGSISENRKMGMASNLITDMTLKGATPDELAAAVRYAQTIIDTGKHNLDHKQSYIDNDIANLQKKYQGDSRSLFTTKTRKVEVTKRSDYYTIDEETGEKVYREKEEFYTDKSGKTKQRKTKVNQMSLVSDAYELSSGTKIESVYADHANEMKSLAKKARIEAAKTKDISYNPSAKETFSAEVASLNDKLKIALMNAPKERQAQLLGNYNASREIERRGSDLGGDEKKKIKGRALVEARGLVGAKKQRIVVTDKEWEAIQAGAISPSRLKQILANADNESINKHAMPRRGYVMTPAKIASAKSLLSTGYTLSEVADSLGVSVSTIENNLPTIKE